MRSHNESFARALPALMNGALTLVIAWPLAAFLGFTATIDLLMDMAGPVSAAVLIGFYAAVYVATATVLRGMMMLLGLTLLGGNGLIDGLGFRFASRVRAVLASILALLRLIVFLPLRAGLGALWKPVEDRLFALASRMEIDRRLRAEYRAHYREQYASFAAFRRAYFGEEPEAEKPEPAPATETVAQAFALFGLPEGCAAKELEAKYRALMKTLHPDAGGSAVLAAKLNQARDLIRKSKGWTT